MTVTRYFKDHPDRLGETYKGHLVQASRFGFKMIGAGIACLLHGLFPFLFERTGSDAIRALHAEMRPRREQADRSRH